MSFVKVALRKGQGNILASITNMQGPWYGYVSGHRWMCLGWWWPPLANRCWSLLVVVGWSMNPRSCTGRSRTTGSQRNTWGNTVVGTTSIWLRGSTLSFTSITRYIYHLKIDEAITDKFTGPQRYWEPGRVLWTKVPLAWEQCHFWDQRYLGWNY